MSFSLPAQDKIGNTAPASASDEWVLLLHGLSRSASSMQALADYLQQQGYHVINIDYDSRHDSIAKLANSVIPPALENCVGASKIHFVSHSMGGILIRQYLAEHSIENLGRVVMLGLPNQGSEVIDKLAGFPGFAWFHGPGGMELGTGSESTPNSLGAVNYEVGVIAGTRSINLILSTMIPGEDDGKVSVERTKVEGMQDHLVVKATHPLMMRKESVMQQVLYFLQKGKFNRGSSEKSE
jgi:pimeloyl-ACP methyl ester carboxylesterase